MIGPDLGVGLSGERLRLTRRAPPTADCLPPGARAVSTTTPREDCGPEADQQDCRRFGRGEMVVGGSAESTQKEYSVPQRIAFAKGSSEKDSVLQVRSSALTLVSHGALEQGSPL